VVPVRARAPGMFLAAGVLLAAVQIPVGAGAAPSDIPARVVAFDPPVSTSVYQGVSFGRTSDPRDDRYTRTTWRVVERTGNCCETYLTATSDGRLLDFGGSYVNYTDDRGLTWFQVQPLTPLVNGEGAIVVAPDGDVLGVEWDPYSGDHLQTYKFEADTQQWLYTEMPLHQPFYDREWISVAPGPVTIEGQTYDYVSFIKGGWPTKEVWFYSTDGLNYTRITSKALESTGTTQGALPTASPSDWVQANSNGGMTGLGAGGLLGAPDFGSDWSLLDGSAFTWSSYEFPDGSQPEGRFQIDSAGRIHNVVPSPDGDSFLYRTSPDGGRSWRALTVALPPDTTFEEWDFRANREAGVSAVAIHAHDASTGNDQDLVYKLDIRGPVPVLKRLYDVGLGDVDATAGVGNDIRYDFGSVAILPGGRVAVSFMDSTTTGPTSTGGERITPAVAIEGTTTLGPRIKPEPIVPPVLGQPYASYTFDADAEGWSTSGIPTWSRSSPGTKDGTDDPNTASFGIEGPTQYVDEMDASLTSPPIATDAGKAVVEFWLKSDVEEGFDYVNVEWTSDGALWHPVARFTGRNASYPDWSLVTLGFESPGGEVRVRFRFSSDQLCSAADQLCSVTGARVDEVVVGKQAV
jgi:hypothetical protein